MYDPRLLVIVTGAPGTGKSWLAERLIRLYPELGLVPYDALKEEFFDRFGFDSAKEKTRLNNESLAEYWRQLDEKMQKGRPLLIEYPFCRKHVPSLEELIRRNEYHAVTVVLYGEWPVLYNRQAKRDLNPKRHPGHLCDIYHQNGERHLQPRLTYEEFVSSCTAKDYFIDLGQAFRVDVTDFSRTEYSAVERAVAEELGKKPGRK